MYVINLIFLEQIFTVYDLAHGWRWGGGMLGYVWRQKLFGISSQANKLDMVEKPNRF